MPRATLPSSLKGLKTMEVVLTQMTEDDIWNHFVRWFETYDDRTRVFLRKQYEVLDRLSDLTHNIFARWNWRKGVPELKYKSGLHWLVNSDDLDRVMETIQEYQLITATASDLHRCNMEFKWSDNEQKCELFNGWVFETEKFTSRLHSNDEEMKQLELLHFGASKRKWEEDDKEWIEYEKLRRAHESHRPREYYEELFKTDPEAVKFYKGVIPDHSGCSLCVQAAEWRKKKAEEQHALMEQERLAEEEYAREQAEERRQHEEERRRRDEEYKRIQSNLKSHTCEECEFTTKSKFAYETHMNSKEHRKCYNLIHFFCKDCGLQCRSKIEYENHLTTNKHKKNSGQLVEETFKHKEPTEYHCECCDYKTKHKQNFEKHCISKKHEERAAKV